MELSTIRNRLLFLGTSGIYESYYHPFAMKLTVDNTGQPFCVFQKKSFISKNVLSSKINHLTLHQKIKILDYTKQIAFAEDMLNVVQWMISVGRKQCEKRRKCWLPACSPFPTLFSQAFLFQVV